MTQDPTTALRDIITTIVREVLAEERASQADHATTATTAASDAPRAEWITDLDLATWLGMSRETIQQWRSRGEGPPYCKVGRAVRYRVVEVSAWLAARRRGR